MGSLADLGSRIADRFGLVVARKSAMRDRLPIEVSAQDRDIIQFVRPFTMTSPQRIWSLLESVRHVCESDVAGDFVECGVWRGGSLMAMALKLRALGVTDRTIWLYDTFSGMTAPTAADVEAASGRPARELMDTTDVGDGDNVWAFATRGDVEANLRSTGYPMDRFTFVEGDVAVTLPAAAPDRISLLRLDTDWYESTKLGLEVLYPRLSLSGVCIFDDYGHWAGARRAVDEYFRQVGIRPLMHPIDYSGRVLVKTR